MIPGQSSCLIFHGIEQGKQKIFLQVRCLVTLASDWNGASSGSISEIETFVEVVNNECLSIFEDFQEIWELVT